MEDRNISPEESLRVIERMLVESRNKFYNNGFAFLFWGVLIMLACLAQYIIIKMGFPAQSDYVWLVAIVLGLVVTFFYFVVWMPKRRLVSRSDSNNGMIWIGFGITYFVLIFLCIKYNVNPAAFIWCLLGFGMFASGGIYRFKPLFFGAVVFWLSAIIAVQFNVGINGLWIGALAMLFGYILPGYLLWKKAKMEANV